MTSRLTLLAMPLLMLAACDQPKPREPVAPAQVAPAPSGPPAADIIGLTRREEMATHTLDRINEALDPYNRPATVSGAGPMTFTGFIFDPVAKKPGKAATLVVDGTSYAMAYGQDRSDVAAYFKDPAVTKVGFTATLPGGALKPGRHVALLRVVSADGAAYFDSAEIPFTVQ